MKMAVNRLDRFLTLFNGAKPAVIGMIHVRALPGTPKYENESIDLIIEHACREADIYKKNGLKLFIRVIYEKQKLMFYSRNTICPTL